jgi:hypothetical protein
MATGVGAGVGGRLVQGGDEGGSLPARHEPAARWEAHQAGGEDPRAGVAAPAGAPAAAGVVTDPSQPESRVRVTLLQEPRNRGIRAGPGMDDYHRFQRLGGNVTDDGRRAAVGGPGDDRAGRRARAERT